MIEDQIYREALLEVFNNPQNRGEIDKPDFEAMLLNPLCGDEVRLQIKLANNQPARRSLGVGGSPITNHQIEKAVFSGNGCAISQASASLLAEHIEGMTLAQVNKLDSGDILELMGINPTPARLKCALLSLDVLMEALKNSNLRN